MLDRYKKAHDRERDELAGLDVVRRNELRACSFDCQRYENSSLVINSFSVETRDVTKKPRNLLKGTILSAIFGAALGYLLLGAYNLGRNHESEHLTEEISKYQQRREIEKLNRRELQDRANMDRAKYYFDRILTEEANN